MSRNSSSSWSDTLSQCFRTPPTSFIFSAYSSTNILVLLPLVSTFLHHGLRQWRKIRSSSSSASMSHTDVFTFHMVVMELLSVLGCLLCLFSFTNKLPLVVGSLLVFMTWFGETFFHVLTCVERYLAVIHPITYRNLKNERGTRIRNAGVAGAWLLCVLEAVICLDSIVNVAVNLLLLLPSILSVSFCSRSVLLALNLPGPVERTRNGERVDRTKRKAALTVVTIWASLVMRFCWCVLWVTMYLAEQSNNCAVLVSGLWSSLPSSVVLPLLFLHRENKLPCFHRNAKKK